MAASLVERMCVWLGPGFGLGIWYGQIAARLVVTCFCAWCVCSFRSVTLTLTATAFAPQSKVELQDAVMECVDDQAVP